MERAYYSAKISQFLQHSENYILGELAKNNQFDLNDLQRNTWIEEIKLLQRILNKDIDGSIVFEYTIPRIGSRVDVVLLIAGTAFLLEFKCGECFYSAHGIDQVLDYALDLKNFHKASHNMRLIPMLLATNAPNVENQSGWYEDGIAHVVLCNENTLKEELSKVLMQQLNIAEFNDQDWINSPYTPTPTIIEAAQVLYKDHSVKEISRSDASAENLGKTAAAISKIIKDSQQYNEKSICFITGVPGAGKTLAGLNIACEEKKAFADANDNESGKEKIVFLSGNGPLVLVLREALARDYVENNGGRKEDAKRKVNAFIQNVHNFRDDALASDNAPYEKVAIFDEAQRAWDEAQTNKFMKTKKGMLNFNQSEPEFLIDVMNRHEDWSVIICLIGGGQEINDGEAGIVEWFNALNKKFPDWKVYISNNITDSEYCPTGNLMDQLDRVNYEFVDGLHLGVSLRSFRSEKLASFVKFLLDVDCNAAKEVFEQLKKDYPIVITRNLHTAKEWIKDKARGNERYGMTASSGAKRLRTDGIWVQNKIDPVNWFLNGKDDVRSSYFLEETATEFDIQGLEVDFSILAWDADFRFDGEKFTFNKFSGTKWQNINNESDKNYLKNAYRVLLTRARQGVVIYVPNGDSSDVTKLPGFYDNTYIYLRQLGIPTLDDEEIDLEYEVVKPLFEEPIIPIIKAIKPKEVKVVSERVGGPVGCNVYSKKVGKIAREDFAEILKSGKVENDVLEKLQDAEYSRKEFDCRYSILKYVENANYVDMLRFDESGHSRYYCTPIKINGKCYLLTSEWYEKSKSKLLAFINKYN